MQRKILVISPARSTIATALQPDYRKWEAVRVGMTRSEAEALLGKPLTGREQRPKTLFSSNYPVYGFVSYPSLPHKWAMLFVLGINKENRVWYKSDPFGSSPLSRSGKPSKPVMITPQVGSSFRHYPRLLDVRWFPSSGVYPMHYELELGLSLSGNDEYHAHIDYQRYGQPHAVLNLPGAQPYRIRVRGRNANGTGHWSEYSDFTFWV